MSRPGRYKRRMRRCVGIGTFCALVLTASAGAAGMIDGSVAVNPVVGKAHARQIFVAPVTVSTSGAGAPGEGTFITYSLTLTGSRGLTVLKVSGAFTTSHCAPVRAGLACTVRALSDASGASSVSVRLRAVKAGKYTLTAKVVLADDSDPSNDSASRAITVRV